MRRLILLGGIFILTIVVSSCKKEVIQPNSRAAEAGVEQSHQQKAAFGSGDVNGNNGDITDPNDDDYTRKPKKTVKK